MKQKLLLIVFALLFSAVRLIAQNVGIGTNAPNAKLDILSPGNSMGLRVLSGNDNEFSYLSIGRITDYAQIAACTDGAFFIDALAGDMAIKNFNAGKILFGASFNSSSAMAIIPGGNVGIGTTTPSEKLDVAGNVIISGQTYIGGNAGIGTTNPGAKLSFGTSYPNQRLLSFFDDYVGNNGYGIGMESNPASAGSRLMIYCSGQTPTNAVTFGSYTGAAFTERMRVEANGNVGIGTNTPSQKLDVIGTTSTTNFQMTSGAGNGLILRSDASGNASWVNIGTLETDPKIGTQTTNFIPKWNGSALTSGLVFDNGTNIGIGTTTPSQKLDVTGNTNITGKLMLSDSALLNGNAKVTGYTNLKDTVYIDKIIKQDAETAPALQNSWVNYGAPFADAKYYKDKEGVVHLKGLIKSGSITANTVLFNLPVGYRPSTSGQLIFTVDNATGIGRVDVKTNGDVVVVTAASNLFLNLTGISFRAD